MRRFRWVAVAAGFLAGTFACRQIVGIGDSPPSLPDAGDLRDAGDANAAMCGLAYPVGSCGECANTSCCAESMACAASPSCAPYELCVAACGGDAKCNDECLFNNRIGTSVSQAAALNACIASKCATPCAASCGGLGALLAPPDAAAACQSCFRENVCEAGAACAESTECQALGLCYLGCPTNDCRQACSASNPDGSAMANPILGAWLNGSCNTPCDEGENWECVGHVSWPTPKVDATDVTFQIVDALEAELAEPANLKGIEAVYCGGNSIPEDGGVFCTGPLAGPLDTNDGGLVTLSVDPQLIGPEESNYFQIASGPMATEEIIPELLYFAFNLSEKSFAQTTFNSNDIAFITGSIPAFTRSELQLALHEFLPDAGLTPGTGMLVVTALDCNGRLARNVNVATSPAGKDILSFKLGASNVTFVNVPQGVVTVTATPASLAEPMGQATVLVLPNMATGVALPPTPTP
jgi:hypothetical protein